MKYAADFTADDCFTAFSLLVARIRRAQSGTTAFHTRPRHSSSAYGLILWAAKAYGGFPSPNYALAPRK